MTTRIIVSLIVCGLLAAPVCADDRRAGNGERQWLSIAQVHARLESAGYRNIEKIERESGRYEVKATTADGERIKLYVHPHSGAVIDRKERDHDASDRYAARGNASEGRSGGECNKRRCRDDLPSAGKPAPSAGK